MAQTLVEKRFPLYLGPALEDIHALYDAAKQASWDPARSIPWARFAAADYPTAALNAARLSWSRRVWLLYGRIAETPGLLVRFCLEHQRESDPKYFLTVRSSEETWHIDACHRFAVALGGFVAQPMNADYAARFNQDLHRKVLDGAVPLDGYVAAHVALRDGLDLALHRAALEETRDPVARVILELMIGDKTRHAAFGWLYLQGRSARWTAEDRAAIDRMLAEAIATHILSGTLLPWLAAGEIARDAVVGDIATAESGLGAASRAREKRVLREFLSDARDRFATLGLALPRVLHPQFNEA